MSFNNIQKIEHLDGLGPNLKCLTLSSNSIIRIEGLNKLEHLESLDLANNRISTISQLWNNFKLKTLILSQNRIRNLGDILQNTELEVSDMMINYLVFGLEGKSYWDS
jgi:protein phosphatase 1 regulatory subunit 7